MTPGGKIDVGSVILDQNVNGSADDFSGYSEVVFSVVDKAFDDPVPNGSQMVR